MSVQSHYTFKYFQCFGDCDGGSRYGDNGGGGDSETSSTVATPCSGWSSAPAFGAPSR